MKLALGPVQYYWPKDMMAAFYREVAAMPVDIVYLGETVCARRHELREDDWLAIAEGLEQAGKEVVWSTQVLLESGAHMQAMQRIAGNGRYTVEANDMGAVGNLENLQPFVAGPHLNLYNPAALDMLAKLGMFRWVMPLEMSRGNLAAMQRAMPEGMQTEVFAYGRIPLAFSARCFTARYHNLQKDACGFKCLSYPDGLEVRTREGQAFLVFNGIQTQSANVYNLVTEVLQMQAMDIDILRIAPQSSHTGSIVRIFRQVIEQTLPPADALEQMRNMMPGAPCNGYWHGDSGMTWHKS